MPRQSKEEEVRTLLREYFAIAEVHSSYEYPIHVRGVATALKISPTTIYKYKLDNEIAAAEERPRENAKLTGKALRRRDETATIQDLKADLKQERERNKHLVAQIAIMEANAARLGFDPEEMYRPLLKPVRTVSRAGNNKKGRVQGKHWAANG